MNNAIFKKTCVISVSCVAMLLFVLSIPITSHGDDDCDDISVRVAANIINITSQGEGHAVVIHTLQDFWRVDLDQTQVFVNNGPRGGEDCEIVDFGQREDDNGHLDIYFLLDNLKECEEYLEINYELNILRIEGVETDEDGDKFFCGESDMHIVGKQGPGKQ